MLGSRCGVFFNPVSFEPFGETIVKRICRGALPFCACMASLGVNAADSLLPPPPAPAIPPTIEITSYSTATTRRIWDQYLEGTFALQSNLEESGFRTRLGLGFGRYDYPIAGEDADVPFSDVGLPGIREFGKVSGRYQEGAFLFGYEFVTDRYSVLALIGGGVVHQGLSQPDPENPARGTRWGFNVALQVDANPTDQTMFYGYGAYSTAFQTSYVDVRPGYLIFEHFNLGSFFSATNIYVGPQGVLETNARDYMWKAGAHLTISEMGPFHTTIAGGYAYDQYNKSGAYGLIETSVRF
ncbi:hypothetical protein Ms3S1_18250 [Methylosinus sp. 3S-1]